MDKETSCTMVKWYRVTKGIHESTAAAETNSNVLVRRWFWTVLFCWEKATFLFWNFRQIPMLQTQGEYNYIKYYCPNRKSCFRWKKFFSKKVNGTSNNSQRPDYCYDDSICLAWQCSMFQWPVYSLKSFTRYKHCRHYRSLRENDINGNVKGI